MTGLRTEIRFLLNDEEVALSEVGPCDTLLDFLRVDRRLTGTREGCAEGDCGACTVLVGRLTPEGLRYETVNACIRFLATLDGRHVVTVEHLKGADGGLHPVQRAMVDHHGAQCGFCTPGIVMSLYALWMERPRPTEAEIETALQGNLCRCTGYAPIVRAAAAAADYGAPEADPLIAERAAVEARLGAMADGRRVVVARGGEGAMLPASLDDFALHYAETPEATVVAGATDVGLWVTKQLRSIGPAIFIDHLDELKAVELDESALTLGAGVTYSEAEAAVAEAFPWLADYWRRIGGWQVRNMGTIGGNIANGSPIGDTPPPLIALGAEITLNRGGARRRLALEDFFIAYGEQDRAPGEFVESVRIPRPGPGARLAAWKISKRRDEDISSLAAAFNIVEAEGRVASARVAFGGMAATPKRARAAEAALTGAPFVAESFERAAEALAQDFTPLTDWRASAEYRMLAARNLFRRFWLQEGEGRPARLARA